MRAQAIERAYLINAHTSMNRVALIIYLLMAQPEHINSNEKRVNSPSQHSNRLLVRSVDLFRPEIDIKPSKRPT